MRCPKNWGNNRSQSDPAASPHTTRARSIRVAHVPRVIRAEQGRVIWSTRALAAPLVRVRGPGGRLEISPSAARLGEHKWRR